MRSRPTGTGCTAGDQRATQAIGLRPMFCSPNTINPFASQKETRNASQRPGSRTSWRNDCRYESCSWSDGNQGIQQFHCRCVPRHAGAALNRRASPSSLSSPIGPKWPTSSGASTGDRINTGRPQYTSACWAQAELAPSIGSTICRYGPDQPGPAEQQGILVPKRRLGRALHHARILRSLPEITLNRNVLTRLSRHVWPQWSAPLAAC